MVEQLVAILVLGIFGGLAIALYLAEKHLTTMRQKAIKDESAATDHSFEENKAKLNEVLSELEQKRQEELHNLDLLKHAIWRPGCDGPRRPHDL